MEASDIDQFMGEEARVVSLGNLRKRVSQLVRFGVGKAKNHRGGEWLWQLQEIGDAQVWMWCCSRDEPERIEYKLLKQFKTNHRDLPLANRRF